MIWDHHCERRTWASNQEVIAPKVREDDDVHLVMMHDGTGDGIVEGGGGEGCGGEDDGEDNEEEEQEDFLEDRITIEGCKRVK